MTAAPNSGPKAQWFGCILAGLGASANRRPNQAADARILRLDCAP